MKIQGFLNLFLLFSKKIVILSVAKYLKNSRFCLNFWQIQGQNKVENEAKRFDPSGQNL